MTIEEQILERGAILDKQQILHDKDRDNLDSAIDLILDADSVTDVLKPLR